MRYLSASVYPLVVTGFADRQEVIPALVFRTFVDVVEVCTRLIFAELADGMSGKNRGPKPLVRGPVAAFGCLPSRRFVVLAGEGYQLGLFRHYRGGRNPRETR